MGRTRFSGPIKSIGGFEIGTRYPEVNTVIADSDGVLYQGGNKITSSAAELNYLDGAAGDVVAGVAAGYKLARGSITLDGANPTPVSHGLSTVVGHCVSIDSDAAPNDPSTVTSAVVGSTLNVYAWKPTSAATTTLVASTNTTVNVEWIAVGT